MRLEAWHLLVLLILLIVAAVVIVAVTLLVRWVIKAADHRDRGNGPERE
ncbi:Flp pilus assembly protein TadB [Paenarthrobacter sp. 4246]